MPGTGLAEKESIPMSILRTGLLIVAAVLAPWLANAQSPVPAFTDSDRAAIPDMIHDYFAAFTAKDYGAFDKYFQAPFMGYGREPVVIATFDEVLKRYQGIRDPLDAADYSASKATEIRLIPMTPVLAMANVHWQRLKKDGTLLDEGSEFMLMSKSTGTWKIAGVLPQQFRLYGQ
jgi:hypothetical protein